METIFGISIGVITTGASTVTFLVLLITVLLALRRRILLTMALRNIPRQKAQSGLMLLGLTLSTALISSASILSHTQAWNLQKSTISGSGGRDILISKLSKSSESLSLLPRSPEYFSTSVFYDLQEKLAAHHKDKIDGWAASISESASVVNPQAKQAVRMVILGADAGFDRTHGQMQTLEGPAFIAARLQHRTIYLNSRAANRLQVHIGQSVKVFGPNGKADDFTVAGTVDFSPPSLSFTAGLIRLDDAQELWGHPNEINRIELSLRGDALSGVEYSQEVGDAIYSILDSDFPDFDLVEEKVVALQQAESLGNTTTSTLFIVSLFATAAGCLLVFLIFVLQAAERKHEMGILRALGTQRSELLQLFLFEGLVLCLVAAVLGTLMSIGLSYVLITALNNTFGQFGFSLDIRIELQSLALGSSLGVLIAFLTILAAAVQASKVSVIAAIHDIPEQVRAGSGLYQAISRLRHKTRAFALARQSDLLGALRSLASDMTLIAFELCQALLTSGVLLILLGVFLLGQMLSQDEMNTLPPAFIGAGVSSLIVGGGLLARRVSGVLGITNASNPVFSLIGLALLAYWSLPMPSVRDESGTTGFQLERIGVDLDWFFMDGLMMVAGATLLTASNAHLLLRVLAVLSRRGLGRAALLIVALAHLLESRVRTGLSVAMFALVFFMLTVTAVLYETTRPSVSDDLAITNSFDLVATVVNPIIDLAAKVETNPNLTGRVSAIGGVTKSHIELAHSDPAISYPLNSQPAQDEGLGLPEDRLGWAEYPAIAVDRGFLASVQHPFLTRAEGYADDRAIWEAIANHSNYAVVDTSMVQSRTEEAAALGNVEFRLRGVYKGDKTMLPYPILVRVPGAGQAPTQVWVIGVLAQSPQGPSLVGNYELLEALVPIEVPLTHYYFRAAPGQDQETLRRILGFEFASSGLDPVSIVEEAHRATVIEGGLAGLLKGFLALGLLVGISAVAVLSMRAVVERRCEIGVLRAIGTQTKFIQLSFLLESGFVVGLGSTMGVLLGLVAAFNYTVALGTTEPSPLDFRVPWLEIGGIVLMGWVAVSLTTLLCTHQVSRVDPAEMLRVASGSIGPMKQAGVKVRLRPAFATLCLLIAGTSVLFILWPKGISGYTTPTTFQAVASLPSLTAVATVSGVRTKAPVITISPTTQPTTLLTKPPLTSSATVPTTIVSTPPPRPFWTPRPIPHDAVVNTPGDVIVLREGPGIRYPATRRYVHGTPVEVRARDATGDWLHVQAPDGAVGWMMVRYLTLNVNMRSLPIKFVVYAPSSDAVVDTPGDVLLMRSGPSSSSPVVGKYLHAIGVQVMARSLSGQWLYVQAPDGRVGWMMVRWLVVNIDTASLPIRMR